MNQEIRVSIIIPVYKVEPYIVRCVESVLHQTYRNIEVILVDDYTPDQSMELAKKIIRQSPLSQDFMFVFLSHDQNRGLSVARNTGIDASTGDYIYFLDSDDELKPFCIESLVNNAEEYGLPEIVIGSFIKSLEDNKDSIVVEDVVLNPAFYDNNMKILDAYLYGEIYQMGWNKMIKRDFLLNNKLYFFEGILHEDFLWTFILCNKATTMLLSQLTTYIYKVRKGSIMTSMTDRNYESTIRILNIVRNYYNTGYLDRANIKSCHCYNDMFEKVSQSIIYSKMPICKKVSYLIKELQVCDRTNYLTILLLTIRIGLRFLLGKIRQLCMV